MQAYQLSGEFLGLAEVTRKGYVWHFSVDVARGLALLFGLGTRAPPRAWGRSGYCHCRYVDPR
jgi:hypothetical protein